MQRLILSVPDDRPAGVPPLLRCQYNPEDLTLTHAAGLVQRPLPLADTAPMGLPDHNGPGRTVLSVRLLFEAGTDTATGRLSDVRHQTRALHALAQRPQGRPLGARATPYRVDVIWGKSMALSGCIAALSERLDMFDAAGVALRSWVALEVWASPDSASGPPMTLFDPLGAA